MKVLLLGGSGFVGTHLAHCLKSQGHKVVVADLFPPSDEDLSFLKIDVRSEDCLSQFNGDEIDSIVNLAAVHRTPGHPDFDYFETNILGAGFATKLAEKLKIKKIVFTSSIAVYGAGESEKFEDSLCMPNIPYGISKLQAEFIHREWALRGSGRCLSILRPGVVFGKGEQGNFTRIAKALRRGLFVYPGRKDAIKSFIYVKDLCKLIKRELGVSSEELRVFNAVVPKAHSVEEICLQFNSSLGYKIPRLLIPFRLITGIAAILRTLEGALPFILSLGLRSERIAKLVNSTHISGERLRADGFEFSFSLKEALTDWSRDCSGSEDLY
ncbi:NAD(P)-dependent oxidoreductase [bacterium]|nr:NAD(P)-dependent oxidoreductase [bacterium]